MSKEVPSWALMWLLIAVISEGSKEKEVEQTAPEDGEILLAKHKPATRAPLEQVSQV